MYVYMYIQAHHESNKRHDYTHIHTRRTHDAFSEQFIRNTCSIDNTHVHAHTHTTYIHT
jgi:hypothetical protein